MKMNKTLHLYNIYFQKDDGIIYETYAVAHTIEEAKHFFDKASQKVSSLKNSVMVGIEKSKKRKPKEWKENYYDREIREYGNYYFE